MKVSVLIPNYNYGHLIAASIDSVLAQLEPGDELIVVDDGSTDDSREVIARYGDKLITIFQKNSGQAAAFSAGFAKATGDIIALLDSDDVFFPGKLTALRTLYTAHPEAGWIFHDLAVLKPEDKVMPAVASTLDAVAVDQRALLRSGKLAYDAPATSGLTFRRAFIGVLFPLPTADSIYISDHYIKFYALYAGQGVHVRSALGGQLFHGSNLYSTSKPGAAKAKIFVNTALAMRTVMPEGLRFCDSIFGAGLLCAYKAGNVQQLAPVIAAYLQQVSLLSRACIQTKLLLKRVLGK